MKKRASEKEEVQREAKRERIGNGISSSDVNANADADADADADAHVDHVEEFFDLLERIEATEKQFGALRKINNRTSTPLHANKEAAWRPSFEWEDFCSNRIGTRDVDPGCASKAQEGNSKQGNPVANVNGDNDSVKGRQCVCVDLNLPSISSSSSAELQLFN